MKFENTIQFLQQLNEAAVFVSFEDRSWNNEPTDSAEAGYFGEVISISFPNSTKEQADEVDLYSTFYLQLFKPDSKGNYDKIIYPPFDKDFDTIAEAVEAINAYIHTRPFKIVWHGAGLFRLIDPEGMDYIGEYIGLADAERTCCNNFII